MRTAPSTLLFTAACASGVGDEGAVYGAVLDAAASSPAQVLDTLVAPPTDVGSDDREHFSSLDGFSRVAFEAFAVAATDRAGSPAVPPTGTAVDVVVVHDLSQEVVLGFTAVGFDRRAEHAVLATWSACRCSATTLECSDPDPADVTVCAEYALHVLTATDGRWTEASRVHLGSVN